MPAFTMEPASHNAHAVLPSATATVPLEHGVQGCAVRRTAAYVPSAQGVQLILSALKTDPATQSVHAVNPHPVAKLPAAHVRHVDTA